VKFQLNQPFTIRIGGAEGDRTPDLLIANEALSQLSYGPNRQRIRAAATDFGNGHLGLGPGQVNPEKSTPIRQPGEGHRFGVDTIQTDGARADRPGLGGAMSRWRDVEAARYWGDAAARRWGLPPRAACFDTPRPLHTRDALKPTNQPMRAILDVVRIVLQLYIYLLVASAILSWLIVFNVVNTRNQFVAMVVDFLYRITEPLLRPIRRIMPNLGGIDVSPVILILLIILIDNIIIRYIYPNVF
jgi:YggT family protein